MRLPRALVEELARTTSMAQSEWVAARAASDFARFRPWLEKIIQLKRQESACLAGSRPSGQQSRHPLGPSQPCRSPPDVYDPLLDEYEPGAGSAELAVLFDALRRELAPLVASDRRGRPRRSGITPSAAASGNPAATGQRSSSGPIRAIARGSSARRWPRRWASTSGAGGWT